MNKSVITNRYIIGYVRKYLSPREDKDIRKEDILKNVIANISTGAYNDYKITIMAPTIKESKDYIILQINLILILIFLFLQFFDNL